MNSRTQTWPKFALLAALSAAVAVRFVLAARPLWAYTPDDAYITFRYAVHLARGLGPVYNPGDPTAEGYSSPLWMGLCAIGAAAGADIVLFAKLLSAACALTTLVVVAWFVSRGGNRVGRVASALFACAWIAGQPDFVIHSVSGMETALCALLLTLFLERITTESARATTLALLGLALGLTRPEMNLPVITGLTLRQLLLPAERRSWMPLFTVYVLPGAAYFVWRAAYYGSLLPLPFYIKVSGPGHLAGLRDTIRFLAWQGFDLGFIPLFIPLTWSRKTAPALLAIAALIAFFTIPEHLMGYGHRFPFPAAPAIAAFSLIGLWRVLGRVKSPSMATGLALATLVVSFAPGGVLLEWRRQVVRAQFREYAAGMRDAHFRLARQLLASDWRSGRPPLLAIGDAGAVPFLTGWRTLDVFGLNHREIAMSRGEARVRVFARERPDVLVLNSTARESFRPKLASEVLLVEAASRAGMQHVETLRFSDDYYLWVMADTSRWNPPGDQKPRPTLRTVPGRD